MMCVAHADLVPHNSSRRFYYCDKFVNTLNRDARFRGHWLAFRFEHVFRATNGRNPSVKIYCTYGDITRVR